MECQYVWCRCLGVIWVVSESACVSSSNAGHSVARACVSSSNAEHSVARVCVRNTMLKCVYVWRAPYVCSTKLKERRKAVRKRIALACFAGRAQVVLFLFF